MGTRDLDSQFILEAVHAIGLACVGRIRAELDGEPECIPG